MADSPRILVTDDEEHVRNLLKVALETQGYQVFLAKDGQDALEQFDVAKPNAMLMDLLMPRLDGYETIRRIRQLPHGKDVPIIVLTALDLPEWEQKSIEAGATQFLTKPFRSKDVLHCLRTVLETPTASRRSAPPSTQNPAVNMRVRYQTTQGFLNCYVKNLMDGRSFIETDKLLPLGSTFHIEITPPHGGAPFTILAAVKWINLYADNRGMGVQFTFDNPADEKRIQQWVNDVSA